MFMKTISAFELDRYIGDKKYILIDVRSYDDFKKRHICGAINIALEEIDKISLPKDKEIIVYCERGATSIIAASKLMRMGYSVMSVVGGIQAYHGRFICND